MQNFWFIDFLPKPNDLLFEIAEDDKKTVNELTKSFRMQLNLKNKASNDKEITDELIKLSNLSPNFDSQESNFISHELTRKSKHKLVEDSEYFRNDKPMRMDFQNSEGNFSNFLFPPTFLNENVAPLTMKLASPKLPEIRGNLNTDSRYINQQKAKDSLKRIGVYRKTIRNSKALNSSRTDLKIQQSNDYDQEFLKTTHKKKFAMKESDLIGTDCIHPNQSARDKAHAEIIPKEKTASNYQSAGFMKTLGFNHKIDLEMENAKSKHSCETFRTIS